MIMRKVFVFSSILVFVFNIAINAQQLIIEGTVIDDQGNPLKGVKVETSGAELSTITDENGYL